MSELKLKNREPKHWEPGNLGPIRFQPCNSPPPTRQPCPWHSLFHVTATLEERYAAGDPPPKKPKRSKNFTCAMLPRTVRSYDTSIPVLWFSFNLAMPKLHGTSWIIHVMFVPEKDLRNCTDFTIQKNTDARMNGLTIKTTSTMCSQFLYFALNLSSFLL